MSDKANKAGGWRWRMDRAKILRQRLLDLAKERDPIVEEYLALSLNPNVSIRRLRLVHDRLQAMNKRYQVINTEWSLLWHPPKVADPDPEVVADRLWNYFMSTLDLGQVS